MLNILVSGCRDLLDERDISESYPSIKAFQWAVDDLQAAVAALQVQSVHGWPCLGFAVCLGPIFSCYRTFLLAKGRKNPIKRSKSLSCF